MAGFFAAAPGGWSPMGQSPGQGYLAGLVSWMRPIVQPGGSSILRHGGMSPHGSSGVFSTPAAAQETDPGPSSPVDSFRLNPYSGTMCGGVRDGSGVGCQAVPFVYSEQPAVFAVAVGESAAGAAAGRKRRNRDTQAVVQCSAPQSAVGYWQRQVRRLLMQGNPAHITAGQGWPLEWQVEWQRQLQRLQWVQKQDVHL